MTNPSDAAPAKPLNVRIDPEVHDRLQKVCKDRLVHASRIVERALTEFLDKIEGSDPLGN